MFVKNISSNEHLLLIPHLVVQKRSRVRHPIFSSCTLPTQLRGWALIITIYFFLSSSHVGPTTCPGPVHIIVFNPLSCCPRCMAPLFVYFKINMTSAAAVFLKICSMYDGPLKNLHITLVEEQDFQPVWLLDFGWAGPVFSRWVAGITPPWR